MKKKVLLIVTIICLIIVGAGCAKKQSETGNDSGLTQNQQLPSGHPTVEGNAPANPIDGEGVAAKIEKALDEKFPGDWKVSGTTLKKGSYTENGTYQMVDEVNKLYPGSMVSIFVGETRISGSIKDEKGQRVLEGYPTPEDVPATMTSGKIKVVDAGSMGSSSFQKVYIPLKDGDKTIAVMTISIAQ